MMIGGGGRKVEVDVCVCVGGGFSHAFSHILCRVECVGASQRRSADAGLGLVWGWGWGWERV